MTRRVVAVVAVLVPLTFAHADWLGDTLKSAGKNVGRRGVDDAANAAYDGAKKGTKDAIKPGDKSPDRPMPGGKDGDGSQDRKTAAGGDRARSDPASEGPSIEAAESVYSKYDFVPGDRVLFFDDFADTDVGEFPRRWHLKGPKGGDNVAVEVAEYRGQRFLRSTPAQKGERQHESTQYVRLPVERDLPQRFTVEFDAMFSSSGAGGARTPNAYYLYLLDEKAPWLQNSGRHPGMLQFSATDNESANTATRLNLQDDKVHHVAVSVNGTFVKAYVDHARVVNDPDGVTRPIKLIGLSLAAGSSIPSDRVMVANVRVAEGGKAVKSALDADGKIVTHGILFDTGSDRLKPDSLPTLRAIHAILTDDTALRFSIEGHTDDQGAKPMNKALSERRAGAVKEWLVAKGVEAARFRTNGFGDAQPIDSNDTPEGRANNRRVEFVKF